MSRSKPSKVGFILISLAVLVIVLSQVISISVHEGPVDVGTDLTNAIENNTPTHEVEAIIIKRPSLAEQPNLFGQYPIHSAARSSRLDVVKLLIEKGVDVNVKTASNQYIPFTETALHIAARQNDLAIVKALIEHGGNIDAEDWQGQTVLEAALESKSNDVVDYLKNIDVRNTGHTQSKRNDDMKQY
jgi:ankyrin repeat protein